MNKKLLLGSFLAASLLGGMLAVAMPQADAASGPGRGGHGRDDRRYEVRHKSNSKHNFRRDDHRKDRREDRRKDRREDRRNDHRKFNYYRSY